MDGAELYEGREQSLVKHKILEGYLERFAFIVGSKWDTITYVDCFAGPWNSLSPDFSDSSFAIALKQLRSARDAHAQRGHNVRLRCLFLEKDADAYQKLKSFAEAINDVEFEILNGEFENSITKILSFISKGGQSSFPFVFVDPTGWTGIELDIIAPLINLSPGEILINFMTAHILRHIPDPRSEIQASFVRLFGSKLAFDRVKTAPTAQREEIALSEYSNALRVAGKLRYVGYAYILNPNKAQTHFNLIYGTRSTKGIEVFKACERKVMKDMEQVRAAVSIRQTEKRTSQKSLFDPDDMPPSEHFRALRSSYLERAKAVLLKSLEKQKRLSYDIAWEETMSFPLVWDSDLKSWIAEWQSLGKLTVDGLRPPERVPKRNSHHLLIWKS